MSAPRKRRQQGATLVELMVVVGIIGVAAAMAIAYMPRMSLDLRVSRAANTFNGLVREARGRAMANRAWTRICVASNKLYFEEKNRAFGAVTAGGGTCGDGTWQIVRMYPLAGYDFQGVAVPAVGGVIFTPRGLLSAGANTYTFGASGGIQAVKHKVRINNTGLSEKI